MDSVILAELLIVNMQFYQKYQSSKGIFAFCNKASVPKQETSHKQKHLKSLEKYIFRKIVSHLSQKTLMSKSQTRYRVMPSFHIQI